MHRRSWRTFLLFFFDILIVFVAYAASMVARFDFAVSKIPIGFLNNALYFVPLSVVTTIICFLIFRLYGFVMSFVSVKECALMILAVTCSAVVSVSIGLLLGLRLPISVYLTAYLLQVVGVVCLRFSVRIMNNISMSVKKNNYYVETENTMIIGAGAAGSVILSEIESSSYVDMKVCCFIDDNDHKHGKSLGGVKIVGGRDKILEMVDKFEIGIIVVAAPSMDTKAKKEILEICKETECQLRIVPGVYQLVNGEVALEKIRDVGIEDLLGREPIQVDLQEIMGYVKDSTVLVTGGGGSIGSELCRQIASYNPKELIIFDIYENNAYDIQLELVQQYPQLQLTVLIGSVRDDTKVRQLFEAHHPDVVFHAAAHKHVPLMEDSPAEAIKNNVFGTYNVARAASDFKTRKMVLISTDKAVNSTNIMGASKRLCEMVVQFFSRRSKTEFVAVRFGNVLGSNGSVIPVFKKQIASGGPITVTHPDITRYFMTIPEAVSLVLQAGSYAKGGEIFVLDMGEPVRIADLARNLILLSGFTPEVDISIEYVGLRPGEKLYEELLMDEEGMQTTRNKMIHIGAPIPMDDEEFVASLKILKEKCKQHPNEIKALVAQMVPTYHPSQPK